MAIDLEVFSGLFNLDNLLEPNGQENTRLSRACFTRSRSELCPFAGSVNLLAVLCSVDLQERNSLPGGAASGPSRPREKTQVEILG